MTYKGFVDKGWIKPSEPLGLPDGTPVTFSAAKKARASSTSSGKTIKGWKSKSLAELAKAQGTGVLKSIGQLSGDWPEEESVDEFLKSVRKGRR